MNSRRQFLRQSLAFSALATMSGTHAFAAPKPGKDARHLLVVGDWGYEDPTAQISVARAMGDYARQHSLHAEALLMLGDNWYGDLPGGVDCPRWKSNFEDAYPVSLFPGPTYAIPGNHDYQVMPESKLAAELAYAKRPGTRWTMPSLWYRVELPAKNPVMTVIALDSNVNIPGHQPKHPNFTLTEAQQAEQLVWLEAELSKPLNTPFLVVMGHHPIYSDGPHGDHSVLIKDWEPLLRKHNVHLYMAGHDHDLQHLEFANHPTSFFLSGGGGADLYNLKIKPSERGPFAQKVYGFSHIEMTHDLLTLRHLNEQGQQVHAFTKRPDNSVQIIST
ncbi:3',5'-cyclic AMP phosphodiesterase CpdA [Granulicella aggregans]|uniref:3',5'-cyclic AMP phosphodiesterase CpdA n=1 Tax=Granulicella aggregans TaxID=474949 RepID=A0A7W8E543_9BACT|nr:metallophosphoesterase [Granulicella aggregans]MBB5057830.1 3',5'-cyclic AMP phosphodiesterase CpdA [Granulicella aggregans]